MISRIARAAISQLYEVSKRRLYLWGGLLRRRAKYFKVLIGRHAGLPPGACPFVGFLDGTVRKICSPSAKSCRSRLGLPQLQVFKRFNNAKKGSPAVTFQAFVAPDGILYSLSLRGPLRGRMQDQRCLRHARLRQAWKACKIKGVIYCNTWWCSVGKPETSRPQVPGPQTCVVRRCLRRETIQRDDSSRQ